MRLILFSIALLSGGISVAEQSQPKLIRVCLQFIEMPHPALTELLAENDSRSVGPHARAIALTKEGKGRILETCVVLGRSGESFTLESIREEIFPTEVAAPYLESNRSLSGDDLSDMSPTNPMLRVYTAFERRNTGVTVEVGPTLSADERVIHLRISPELVTPLRIETMMEHHDQWGDGSIRMPVYESLRVNTTLSVEPGKFTLVSALTPTSKAPVPAVLRKILVFVRADIVPVSISP